VENFGLSLGFLNRNYNRLSSDKNRIFDPIINVIIKETRINKTKDDKMLEETNR
jgi:hypothetical protein